MQSILEIGNNHVASCGVAPVTRQEPGKYIGYFENQHGEQWVFTYQNGKGTLRGGDIQWDKPATVVDGLASVVLDTSEKFWLMSCWAAATREAKDVNTLLKQMVDTAVAQTRGT